MQIKLNSIVCISTTILFIVFSFLGIVNGKHYFVSELPEDYLQKSTRVSNETPLILMISIAVVDGFDLKKVCQNRSFFECFFLLIF